MMHGALQSVYEPLLCSLQSSILCRMSCVGVQPHQFLAEVRSKGTAQPCLCLPMMLCALLS
jgi:hypothetical protein